jgi:hypothetical protein
VLKLFPGVATEAEIHSLENLRGIRKGAANELHQSQFRKEWDAFYAPFLKNGTQPTKVQLLQKATEMDAKYRSQFTPQFAAGGRLTRNSGTGTNRRSATGGRSTMAKYYLVEPEVAGGWGENTVADHTPGKRTRVQKFHYEFQGWLGDELLRGGGEFIVTDRLARKIERARLSGVSFDEVEVTTSPEFEERYPGLRLPRFLWMKAVGKAGQDDFGTGPDLILVVSQRALDLLKRGAISGAATVRPFEG